jgi:hypothetical protein
MRTLNEPCRSRSRLRGATDSQRPPGSLSRAACGMNCRRFRFRSSPEELTKERAKRSVFLPIKVHIRADVAAMISVGRPSATATTAKAKAATMIIPPLFCRRVPAHPIRDIMPVNSFGRCDGITEWSIAFGHQVLWKGGGQCGRPPRIRRLNRIRPWLAPRRLIRRRCPRPWCRAETRCRRGASSPRR